MKNIVIIGLGAIGTAMYEEAKLRFPKANIYTFSRNNLNVPGQLNIDYKSEKSIKQAAETAGQKPIDLLIVNTGILHTEQIFPEKSVKDICPKALAEVYYINTILPALVAKHFLPKLSKNNRAIFSAISARVGSISDNRLGGWYAYRASKAALNMVIKNLAIEFGRFNNNYIIIGLHPGTVNSKLSKPFQNNVKKLFSPEFSAEKMFDVMSKLSFKDSGKCFAWDGKEILP